MARNSMKKNCLLSTYYGQGTVHISCFHLPLEYIQEFSNIANHLLFLIPGWKRTVAIHFLKIVILSTDL